MRTVIRIYCLKCRWETYHDVYLTREGFEPVIVQECQRCKHHQKESARVPKPPIMLDGWRMH